MEKPGSSKTELTVLKKYFGVLLVLWTVLVGLILLWSLFHQKHETKEMARIQARNSFEKDIVYRRWSANHGGVYVPLTDKTPPNPYLSHIEERDITTPSGRVLTLINPAYMTRQIHELGLEQYGSRGHITSLKPIRPANAADEWERKALLAFEQGVKEVSSIEKIDNQNYMRLMRPMITEQGCLKCHAEQGYKVGDLRGGISVSIPMAPIQAIASGHALTLTVGYFVLWLLGTGGISLGGQRLKQRIQERKYAEGQIEDLAKFPSENPNPVMRIAKDGVLLYANSASELFLTEWGCKTGQTVPDCWRQTVLKVFTSGKQKRVETEHLGKTFSFEIAPVFETNYANLYGRDITERKQAEKERENLAKFPSENPNPVLRISGDGTILYNNKAASVLLDISQFQDADLMLKHLHKYVPKALKLSKTLQTEMECCGKVHSLTFAPVVNSNYVNLYGLDITERKGAEKALHQYEHIVSGSTDMLALLDKRFNYLAANKAYIETFKLSSEQLIGNTVADVFGEEFFRTVIKPNADRCLGGEEVNYQDWFDFPARGRCYMDITYYPYCSEDNKIKGFVVNGRDITEHKIAEEAIKESEKKYYQLIETMNEGLSVSDENYNFTFVNPRFAAILGYPADEIIGRRITEFFDSKNKKIMKMQMAQRRHGEEKSYDITWTGKNGQKIDTIVSPRAFFDKNGDYAGSLGILTDITERRQFERQILRLNKKLELTVAKRTAKLRNTHKLLLEDIKKREYLEREIIEISEREKRRLGQELHDSIGQQFMGVAFMAKVLQQRIADKLPEEAATAAEIVKYVNQATEQTRDIAKILHPVDVIAGGLTKALYELAETTKRLFRINCVLECDEPIETGDSEMAAHLYRITQEAITNAIRHGKAKNISIKLHCNNDKSSLIVKSDGLDFPKEFKARGTGLGLQIMDHRTDIIGGTLSIYKPNGGGTMLTCEFPFKKR